MQIKLGLIFGALLLAAGCGKDHSASSSSGSPEPVAEHPPVKQIPIVVETTGEPDPIASANAVKGGTYKTWGGEFPKSLNYWLDANAFSGEVMGYLFEPLLALHSVKNEPVGILASSWEVSDDKKVFTFHINPAAKWSDGQPITAEDFQFYYDTMMNTNNLTSVFRVDLKRFARPEVVDARTLRVQAQEVHWANFWTAAGLMAFPKHVWEKQDFNKINFEFPVVSGPYEIADLKKDRLLLLRRRADWWGAVKQYNQNKYNFDYVQYRFIEDRNKALEAFAKQDFDTYAIYTAAIWAEKTDFDQVKKGWVVRQQIYNNEPIGFQGFAINLRRPIFQDLRVRQALDALLNRTVMNEKLMYNQYFMLNSYYSDLYPNHLNPAVPVQEYNEQKARSLLADAGWKPGADGILEKDGQKFEIVFLNSMTDIRHYNVYIEDLKKVGIKATIDQISWAEVSKRMDEHQFDVFWSALEGSRLRDPEASWDSSTADDIASNNYPGLKDPRIDGWIKDQKSEMSLDARNEILKKIDLRLAQLIPYILLWEPEYKRELYWNKFGTPTYVFDKFDHEDSIVPYWWVDPQKERNLNEAMKANQPLPKQPGDVHYKD